MHPSSAKLSQRIKQQLPSFRDQEHDQVCVIAEAVVSGGMYYQEPLTQTSNMRKCLPFNLAYAIITNLKAAARVRTTHMGHRTTSGRPAFKSWVVSKYIHHTPHYEVKKSAGQQEFMLQQSSSGEQAAVTHAPVVVMY